MDFQDRQITCLDCHQVFTFTAGEQEFYQRKGFQEEPKRCKPCRERRKERRQASRTAPRAEESGAWNGRGASHPGPQEIDDDIGNRIAAVPRGPREVREVGRVGPREMFDAVCTQCGGVARVPFRPVAGRPVYCRDCYGNRGASGTF